VPQPSQPAEPATARWSGRRPGRAAERVVLLAPDGRPIGEADKATVHGASTPLHLAFSCYAFDRQGRLLVTRRSEAKRTFPGVWSNTCCGHPAPGERADDAVRRRLRDELGLDPADLRLVLPDFAYRASAGGVEENERCPVFLCRVGADPVPDPSEVDGWHWRPWPDFLHDALGERGQLSPWSRLQAADLDAGGHVARFLRTTPST
jgi:isopentenyl-diphosphate delta-isomerase